MLRCNETLFNFDGALHPMKATSRRTFAFDSRSVLLFTALSLGGGAALQGLQRLEHPEHRIGKYRGCEQGKA